jgi:hypothetical protein
MKKIFTLLSLSIFTLSGNSQVLGIYEFNGVAICPVENPNVTAQPTGASFTAFEAAGGLVCTPTANVFNTQGWSTVFDATKYYEFTVLSDLGKVINLDSIVFSTRISNSTPTWHLRSSVDNFASDIATGLPTTTLDTVRLALNSTFSNLIDISFRFYLSGVDNDQRAFRMDNVYLKGQIVNESTTSIDENNLKLISALYPNPGKEIINIILNKNVENSTISVFSTSGNLVYDKKFSGNSTSIDTENLKNGMYFIKFNDGENSSIVKWIKE